MTLTDFLLARIAEDEEAARTANFDPLEHWWLPEQAHPGWLLAECEAKRRIVALHSGSAEWCGWTQGGMGTHDDMGTGPADCDTLCALALPYADHPDYREEWRP